MSLEIYPDELLSQTFVTREQLDRMLTYYFSVGADINSKEFKEFLTISLKAHAGLKEYEEVDESKFPYDGCRLTRMCEQQRILYNRTVGEPWMALSKEDRAMAMAQVNRLDVVGPSFDQYGNINLNGLSVGDFGYFSMFYVKNDIETPYKIGQTFKVENLTQVITLEPLMEPIDILQATVLCRIKDIQEK